MTPDQVEVDKQIYDISNNLILNKLKELKETGLTKLVTENSHSGGSITELLLLLLTPPPLAIWSGGVLLLI
jgi:hypothetical protein